MGDFSWYSSGPEKIPRLTHIKIGNKLYLINITHKCVTKVTIQLTNDQTVQWQM